MGGGVRVLAIELVQRGFAFVVLEGSERLVLWDGCSVRGDLSLFLRRLRLLLDRYRVDALVIEEPAESRRGSTARERLAWAEQCASDRGIKSYPVKRKRLFAAFPESRNRYEIALAVLRLFPELAPLAPEKRKWWETESWSMGKFIAAARAVAALRSLESPTPQRS